MKFKVPVEWTMIGEYEVDAESLQEAIEKVNAGEHPFDELPDGDYLDDSLVVNKELAVDMEENNVERE